MWFFRKKHENLKSHLEIKGNNFFFLLISLLILLFLWGLLQRFSFGKYLFSILLFLTFFSSVYTIGRKNRFTYHIAIFFVVAMVVSRFFYHLLVYPVFFSFVTTILSFLSFFFLAVVILMHVLRDRKVSLNEIYGAICVYLLLGLAWGSMYYLVARIDPQAIFIPAYAVDSQKEFSQYVYYSFITLTSVGYGDIHPVSSAARVLAISEGIVGQIYSVVLIGWLVGNLSGWRNKL